MHKPIIFIIFVVLLAVSISSCQYDQTADFGGTASITMAAKPTNLPTFTPEVVMGAPLTPSPEVKASPTDIPITPTSGPSCFATYSHPIAFMPDNIRILVKADSGVQIFNLQTMKEDKFLTAPTNINGPAVTLTPDGKILAWALADNTIQFVRISDNSILKTLKGYTGGITKLKFSPNGDKLYTASHDTWVRVWDSNGNEIGSFQPTGADNYPSEVLGLGISPDGKMLATVPFDGPVKIWDSNSYQLVRELGGSGGYDTSDPVFSPDGQWIAADLATGLFLWKVSDGTQLLGGNPGINSMAAAFSPDGRFLAYSEIGEKSSVILTSPDGDQMIRTLEGHQSPVWELVFSPDSSLLASADGVEIRIWRVEDGKLLFIGKNACL